MDSLDTGVVTMVVVAVGTTVTTTTAILIAFQKWFMPRAECEHKHKDVEQEHVAQDERHEEVEGQLVKIHKKMRRFDRRLTVYSERQRWIVAGVASLMEKAGANGVPPPPVEPDPELDSDDEEEDA